MLLRLRLRLVVLVAEERDERDDPNFQISYFWHLLQVVFTILKGGLDTGFCTQSRYPKRIQNYLYRDTYLMLPGVFGF